MTTSATTAISAISDQARSNIHTFCNCGRSVSLSPRRSSRKPARRRHPSPSGKAKARSGSAASDTTSPRRSTTPGGSRAWTCRMWPCPSGSAMWAIVVAPISRQASTSAAAAWLEPAGSTRRPSGRSSRRAGPSGNAAGRSPRALCAMPARTIAGTSFTSPRKRATKGFFGRR